MSSVCERTESLKVLLLNAIIWREVDKIDSIASAIAECATDWSKAREIYRNILKPVYQHCGEKKLPKHSVDWLSWSHKQYEYYEFVQKILWPIKERVREQFKEPRRYGPGMNIVDI